MKNASGCRAYRQTARAASAEATGRRIIDAFLNRLREQWYDEIRLEQVAEEAGVTVQTIVRRFGGKAGLLAETVPAMVRQARERRTSHPGNSEKVIRSLVADYERTGDTIIRLLALEPRHAVLREHLTEARRRHRDWVARVFAAELERLEAGSRESTLDALVVAMDVYTWKLLRRDMGRGVAATRNTIAGMVRSTLVGHESPSP